MGRTFKSLQKALRGLETGLSGLDEIEVPGLAGDDRPQEAMLAALARPTPDRLRLIAQAFREGLGLAEIQGACAYDPWFLAQIQDIVRTEGSLASRRPAETTPHPCTRSRPTAFRTSGWPISPGWARTTSARGGGLCECGRCSSGSTPAPPSSPRAHPTLQLL